MAEDNKERRGLPALVWVVLIYTSIAVAWMLNAYWEAQHHAR